MSKGNTAPKRGCIQIRLGKERYTFNDVDISSSSLMDILETLFKIPRFSSVMDEMTGQVDKGINDVLAKGGGDVATTVGDFVVGNATALNIATLSRVNRLSGFDAVSLLAKKTTMTDNAFMFTGDVKGAKAYIGTRRDFILLNPDMLEAPHKLPQMLAFKYASRQAGSKNSPVFRALDAAAEELMASGLEADKGIAEELRGLNELTRAKKLLLLAQKNKGNTKCKRLLERLGGIIRSQMDDQVEIHSGMLVKDRLKLITGYGNNVTSINGHSYTNGFIIGMMAELRDSKSETDVTGSALGDNVPVEMKRFYEDNKDGKYRPLLDDLINSEDAVKEQLFTDGRLTTTLDNIIRFLYTDPAVTMTDEDFEPRIDDYAVDDDYTVEERGVYINDSNTGLNKALQDVKGHFEIIYDGTADVFCTVRMDKDKAVLAINPSKDITADDVLRVREAMSYKSGKNKGEIKRKSNGQPERSSWIIRQDAEGVKDELPKLSAFIKELNTNDRLVTTVYSTVHDDFSMEMAQAANQNGVMCHVYPGYYPKAMTRGEMISYLNDRLNIKFTKAHAVKDLTYNEDRALAHDSGPGLFVSLPGKRQGDLVTIANTKSQKRFTLVLDKTYDFTFRPSMESYGDVYNPAGGYNPGTIFSITMEDAKGRNVVRDAVLTGTRDGKHVLLAYIDKNRAAELEVPVGEMAGNPRRYRPLYPADIRSVMKGGTEVRLANTPHGIIDLTGGGHVFINSQADYYQAFFGKELHEIYDKVKNDYASYEAFLAAKYAQTRDFEGARFHTFRQNEPHAIGSMEVHAKNYSNVNMLEVITNSLKRSGLRVDMMSADDIRSRFGTSLGDAKAFIHDGGIILNRNRCTDDSPVHELMHLLLGLHKQRDPAGYAAKLEQMGRSMGTLPQVKDLKRQYADLSPNDFAEEVLVHVATDYFMGRVQDFGAVRMDDMDIRELASALFKANNKLAFREDSTFMNEMMRDLLLEGDSRLLDDLMAGVNVDAAVTQNRISNIKSEMIRDKNLDVNCE